jgi:hypothetical protein
MSVSRATNRNYWPRISNILKEIRLIHMYQPGLGIIFMYLLGYLFDKNISINWFRMLRCCITPPSNLWVNAPPSSPQQIHRVIYYLPNQHFMAPSKWWCFWSLLPLYKYAAKILTKSFLITLSLTWITYLPMLATFIPLTLIKLNYRSKSSTIQKAFK